MTANEQLDNKCAGVRARFNRISFLLEECLVTRCKDLPIFDVIITIFTSRNSLRFKSFTNDEEYEFGNNVTDFREISPNQ